MSYLAMLQSIWNSTFNAASGTSPSLILDIQCACLKAISRLYSVSLLVLLPSDLAQILLNFFDLNRITRSPALSDIVCSVLSHIFAPNPAPELSTGSEDEYVLQAHILPFTVELLKVELSGFGKGIPVSSGCGQLLGVICVHFLRYWVELSLVTLSLRYHTALT